MKRQSLATVILQARTRKGLSLRKAAGEALSPIAIYRIEQHGVCPKAATLFYLIQRLDLPVDATVRTWLQMGPNRREALRMARFLLEHGFTHEVLMPLDFCNTPALGDHRGLAAEYTAIRATLRQQAGDTEAAARMFATAAENAVRAAEWELAARALLSAGIALRTARRWFTANHFFIRAWSVLPRASRDSLLGLQVGRMAADAFLELKLLSRAASVYETLYPAARARRPQMLPDLDVRAAIMHDRGGEYERARCVNMRLLREFRGRNDRQGMATVLNNLGMVEKHRCNWNEAHRLWMNSLELRGDDPKASFTLTELAEVHARRGAAECAHKAALRAYELAAEGGFWKERIAAMALLSSHEDPVARDGWSQRMEDDLKQQGAEQARALLYPRLTDLFVSVGAPERAAALMHRLSASVLRENLQHKLEERPVPALDL